MNRIFFDNPSFLEYVSLLRQLHALIRAGTDESDEGEALRDRMDEPWSNLSDEETAALMGISEDFYFLSDAPATVARGDPPSHATVQRSVIEAGDAGRFIEAFELLRKCAADLSPAKLAYLRGTIWKCAGDGATAALFFEQAARLDLSIAGPTSVIVTPVVVASETLNPRKP